MSIHQSLRSSSSMTKHRNVLTRLERLARLADEERWDESKSVCGLPKVRSIKLKAKKKAKKEAAEGDAAAGAAAAPAPGAKA